MDKRITGFSIRDIRLPALDAGGLLHPLGHKNHTGKRKSPDRGAIRTLLRGV